MTTTIRRYSLNFLILALVFTSTKAMSESMLEASPVGAPSGDFAAPTQRLMEKLNELDEQHIMKEKIISELKSLLMPGGYGALDFGSDEVVARLYLIATVHPEFLADVLSYHKSAISQSYLECLQTLESRIRLNLDYLEAAERSALRKRSTICARPFSTLCSGVPRRGCSNCSLFRHCNSMLSKGWRGKKRTTER